MTIMPAKTGHYDALAQLCLDLRVLREQAGGPSVRSLSEKVGLGKSQVDTILHGRIRRPPGWEVVRGLVEAFYKHAHDHGRVARLSIHAGLEEYWRPRYALVEHALAQPRRADEAAEGVVVQQVTVVPRQLPPVAPHFAGREAELAALTSALQGCGPLLVTGMAGVGKTTLAVAWAHQMAHRFPDGQLYVDLRGFDPAGEVVSAAQAMRGLLEGLGVPPRSIPHEFGAQVGLYRSLLAEREMLVLLDNARDADQVRVLLPGGRTCRAIVTSRMELTGLVVGEGAHPIRLEVLPPADARQLLVRRIGWERVSAEPQAVEELIEICGRLPIALAIVAARAATRPGFALSDVAAQMRGKLRSLDPFRTGDSGADLPALFALSYGALSPESARLLRLLSLHVGNHVSATAAASLAGVAVPRAEVLLAELTQACLLTETGPESYGFHDLVRAYALEVVQEAESEAQRHAARRRMLEHYAHSAFAGAMLLSPQRVAIDLDRMGAGVTSARLGDRDEAMRWFAAEREVLLTAAELACANGFDTLAWQLGWALADFLELRGYFHDWLAVQGHAVTAARRLRDPRTLARNLLILGNACLFAGTYDRAREALQEALEVYRDLGDPVGQGRCEHTIGGMLERQGHYVEALECAERALELYQGYGDAEGQARSHNAIGWCLYRLGRHKQSIGHCRQALQRYEELAHRPGQAATWDSLGSAHLALHEPGEAVRCFGEALMLLRDMGDRFNEAGVLTHLGEAHAAAGQETEARRAWSQALAILDDLNHPDAARLRSKLDTAALA